MNHAMIDLETLSTKSDAAILSVGVAVFNDAQGVIDSAGWALAPTSIHGHIDPATIQWWAQSDKDGVREFSFNGKFTSLSAAFELKSLVAKHNCGCVWAKDPDFDVVILRNWWERVGKTEGVNLGEFPFGFWTTRSVRTIVDEAKRLGHDPNKASGFYAAHNPVDDAVSQARVVIAAREMLAKGAI